MTTSIVSDKGQVTIPSAIRRKVNLRPGTHVEVEVRDNEIVIRPLKSLRELAGALAPFATGANVDFQEIREEAMREMTQEYIQRKSGKGTDVHG